MSIGSTIKKLRRDRDMTQERFAEYLGISANAVSQWERDKTSPDISQLPIIANLFEVTTDYLLGVDVTNKQVAIDQICNEAWEHCNAGDKEGAANIIRTGLVSYPNSFKMMSDLTIFLYQRAFHQKCSSEEHKMLCQEAAGYIDKIISGCNDVKLYGSAVELACNVFPAVGRYNDALCLILNIPDISKDEMLATLYSGDKLIEHTKDIICKSISLAADQTIWLASLNKEDGKPLFDENAKIKLYEKANSFYKTLYEEGDFFFDAESLAESEKHIADIYASRKDLKNALSHLSECVRYVIMFDTYDETSDAYASLIALGRTPVGVNWNNKWNKSHEMLMRLSDDTNYDFLRANDKFRELLIELEQTANIN